MAIFRKKNLKKTKKILVEETNQRKESSPIHGSSDSFSSSSDPTQKLLRKNEKSTQKITEKLQSSLQNSYHSSLSPSARSGPILPPIDDTRSTMRFLRGSDQESPSLIGNWKFLLACVIIGLIVGPAVYGFLFYEEHKQSTTIQP